MTKYIFIVIGILIGVYIMNHVVIVVPVSFTTLLIILCAIAAGVWYLIHKATRTTKK